jgi:enoyl-CoA hydratase
MSGGGAQGPMTGDLPSGLRISNSNGIAVLDICRPGARNALTFEMYRGIAHVCSTLGTGGDTKVLIIRGEGDDAFAAGTDIAQFAGVKSAADAIEYEAMIDRTLDAIENCALPTIASIVGACTGGGAAIAAACDIRIAASNMRYGFPIGRTLGNCLSARSLSRLVAVLGPSHVKSMLLLARFLDPAAALASGFLAEVAETPSDLRRRTHEMALSVCALAPLTLRATKTTMLRLRDLVPAGIDDDVIASCYTSEDFREGIDSFLARRPPKWTGR